MSKKKLTGLLIAGLFVCGCIFAVLQPSVSAEMNNKRLTELPGDYEPCLNLSIDGISYAVSVSALDGLLGSDYAADRLEIRNEAGILLNEEYHICENQSPLPTVSLYSENGIVYECVDNTAEGLVTIYTIGGAEAGYAITETESVSYENAERLSEIRGLQLAASGADVISAEEITEETTEEASDETGESAGPGESDESAENGEAAERLESGEDDETTEGLESVGSGETEEGVDSGESSESEESVESGESGESKENIDSEESNESVENSESEGNTGTEDIDESEKDNETAENTGAGNDLEFSENAGSEGIEPGNSETLTEAEEDSVIEDDVPEKND